MISRVLITISLISSFAFAQEQADESTYQGMQNSTKSSPMEMMIQNEPQIKQIYDQCQTGIENGTITESIASCVNIGFQDDTLISTSERERITQKYFQTDTTQKSYDSANITTIKSENEDPAIANLKSYLYNRLQEALYGDISTQGKKQTKSVDHKVFLDLYKSQVSKNIITSLTSYCIEADPDNYFLIYNDESNRTACINKTPDCTKTPQPECRACTRYKNKQSLKTATNNNKTLTGASQWQECITNIQYICYRRAITTSDALDGFDYSSNNAVTIWEEDQSGTSQKTATKSISPPLDIEYSQNRACEVTYYLKTLRQNLLRLSEIEEKFNDNNNKKTRSIASNVNIYDRSEEGKTIDDLTSITSKEFVEKSNYEKGVQDLEALAKRCKEENDEAACRKFLIAKDERQNLDEASAEFSARSAVMKEKITSMKEEEIRDYLKDEGRDDDEIDQIITKAKADGSNWENNLANQIAGKYEKERLAVINRISNQIENKTAANDDFTYSPDNKDEIDRIESELASRASDYKELIHFNNIVSGYLTISDGQGDSSRNTASLKREIDDSAFAEDTSSEYFDDLKEAIQETDIDSSSSQQDAVNVEVETLNEKLLSQ